MAVHSRYVSNEEGTSSAAIDCVLCGQQWNLSEIPGMEHVICLPVPLQGEQCEFTAGWAPMPSCVRKKNKRGSRPNCASFASGIARRKHTVLVTKYQNSTIDSKRRRLWMNFIFNLCIIFMAEFCVCVCVHECVCAVCACGCVCAVSLFRVACAVLLLAGDRRPALLRY